MPRRAEKNYYAVAIGRKVGIFGSWDACKAQVHKFRGCKFQGFEFETQAVAYLKLFQEPTASVSPSLSSIVSPEDNRKRKRREDSRTDNWERVRNQASTTDVSGSGAINGPIRARGGARGGLTFHIQFDGGAHERYGAAGAGTQIVLSRATTINSSNFIRPSSVRRASEPIQWSQPKALALRQLCKTLIRHYLGNPFTISQAEYQGLICGLENVLKDLKSKKYQSEIGERVALIVQSDSKLIIQQMRGVFECNSPQLKSYYLAAKDLLWRIQVECIVQTDQPCELTLEHVCHESNKAADSLANDAMHAKRSWTTLHEEDGVYEANLDDGELTFTPAGMKWV